MSFDIDPRELDLQGADGMQLVRLLRKLIAEEGGGGGDEPVPSDVSDFFYCTYDVTTYSEIHNALTQNKIPVCPLDGHYYYLVSTTQSRYTFACYNNVNHSIMCVRCASSGWDTVIFLPQEKLTWDYTPTQGSTNPVTSGGVYTAIRNNTVDPEDIQEAVDEWLDEHSSTIGGLSYEAKQALMNCFKNVAWINEDGQDYYDALYDALFGTTPVTPTLESISAVFNQGSAVIYDDATLDSLRPYLTVTAHYSDSTSQVVTTYQLAGTLTAGQSVITASYQGQLATFTVNVTARATLVSISAVFTQGSAIIYDTDSLDTLRQYLVVTANYSDSTTAVVTSYTLSGTLTVGTSTITASYGGETDTFTVTVSIGLDSIAYNGMTYRDIFVTNNLIPIGNFEGELSFSSSYVYLDDGWYYRGSAGSPVQTTEYCVSPTHSLKAFGTGSTQIVCGNNELSVAQGAYLCCVAVKVDRYVAGNAGLQVGTPIPTAIDKVTFGSTEVTDGFVPFVEILNVAANRTGLAIYAGTMNSANCDAYVDDVVVAPLPSGMTKAQGETLYANYLEIVRRAS